MNIKQKLLAEFNPKGYWEGELSSSALSTATATFAIFLAEKENNISVIKKGLKWLADNVNDDGGWGDTVDSESNLSTTLLVWSTLSVAREIDSDYGPLIRKTENWIADKIRGQSDPSTLLRTGSESESGGISPEKIAEAVLKYYGNDRTFSVPILIMCAISGRLRSNTSDRLSVIGDQCNTDDRIPVTDYGVWRYITQLPFELAVLPHSFFRLIKLPVVSYALPALITMGILRHRKLPTWFLPLRILRNFLEKRALRVLENIQPVNGGFLEAAPLTSFVLMSLVSANLADIPVAHKCLEFLLDSVRDDGSWPIDTNLSTWLTTLSLKALNEDDLSKNQKDAIRSWLLTQQFKERHPYTSAAPGGWAWTDLPGGTPDADDTSGVLLALKKLDDGSEKLKVAVADGLKWLINLQNQDGGIPTFCRGWGKLPFDRSCPDITAHALRAMTAWKKDQDDNMQGIIQKSVSKCLEYLKKSQKEDGSWIPLWFGNQNHPDKTNPVYGTSQVLIGLACLLDEENYLPEVQKIYSDGAVFLRNSQINKLCIEELALSIKALSFSENPEDIAFVEKSRQVLNDVEDFKPSPIGLYFASLWYSEKLYPLIFAVDAMGD